MRQGPRHYSCNQRVGQRPVGSEDCLALSIYSHELPSFHRSAYAPVMSYLHGSLFVAGDGWAHEAVNGGTVAVWNKVVVVGLQYRLGVFGFLALEELRAEESSTGNYGMMDQRAALGWVDLNGHLFGGNPARSIVWGEAWLPGPSCSPPVAPSTSCVRKQQGWSTRRSSSCHFCNSSVPL